MTNKLQMPITIHTVIYKEYGMYVMQGVNYDIGAQGTSYIECMNVFTDVISAEMSLRNDTLEGIDKADNKFELMYYDSDVILQLIDICIKGVDYFIKCVMVDRPVPGTKHHDNPEDYGLIRHPIFLNTNTLIVISTFKNENGMGFGELFLSDYEDHRKQTKVATKDIIAQISPHCSMDTLWSLKEAINEEIERHNTRNRESGVDKIWPLDRPDDEQ